MKKCNAFRNRLLAIVAIVAITFVGSCSKDATVEPVGTGVALNTRAIPVFSFVCKPAPKGEGGNLLALKETYRLSAFSNIPVPPPLATAMEPCILSIHASDGSTDGFEIVTGEPSILLEYPVYVKFNKPGYYHVTAKAEHDGALYEQTQTYCVVSRAKSVILPETIELGVPFDLSFEFYDTRYPAPTIEITESLFNNPQCAVLDNDDHGNFRVRIDQPGKYQISTGFGGKFSAWADIKLYWRPEKVGNASTAMMNIHTGEVKYVNWISLCDANDEEYTSLPYGVYFEYATDEATSEAPEPPLSGTKLLLAGATGAVNMPTTGNQVLSVVRNWGPIAFHPFKLHWDMTIPKDEISWLCVHDPDDVIIVDPDNPGGVIDPMDPDFPIRP